MERPHLEELYKVGKATLGSGGNAVVREAVRISDGKKYALKQLNEQESEEKRERFQDEIQTLIDCKGNKGVIPIVDYDKDELWYTMPIAEKIENHAVTLDDKVGCVMAIADTLCGLHERGLSHRDIKPDNLLYYDGQYVLSDFGLVDIPDSPRNLTKNSDRIGPMATIAPEMKRNAKDADGKKADVYSLAKTLWILLTGETKGFEGVYDFNDNNIALGRYAKLRNQHLVEIEELLHDSTQHDPDARPTMAEVRVRLELWRTIKADKELVGVSNWQFIMRRLFCGSAPAVCEWTDVDAVVDVLQMVARLPIMSYLFLPERGDLDFTDVHKASESSCIDIEARPFRFRVKLGRLIFSNYDNPFWNYFLLECAEQKVVVGDQTNEYEEEVVEDTPAHYVSARFAQYGVYDYDSGEKLPEGYKVIQRCLKGKFLIVLKLAPYNRITVSSDGRHSRCSAEEFRNYVGELNELYKSRRTMDSDQWEKQHKALVNGCPFAAEYDLPLPDDGEPQDDRDPDFVKNNLTSFDFSQCVIATARDDNSVVEYTFSVNIEHRIFSDINGEDENYYLCCDGCFKQIAASDAAVYHAYDLPTAERVAMAVSAMMREYCADDAPVLELTIHRLAMPHRLFTKEEIRALMVSADDRQDNKLVITPDGEPILTRGQQPTELYPVVHETWFAGNRYVGRYSSLPDLDSAYHYCLEKWWRYLHSGVGQPMEDYDDETYTSEELVAKIQELMKVK